MRKVLLLTGLSLINLPIHADDVLVAVGRGSLNKGQLICERLADTSARAELARQIQVFVQERLIDRVRERSGEAATQDIEVVREEMTAELLKGVKIIKRTVDEQAGVCTSTATMPRPVGAE